MGAAGSSSGRPGPGRPWRFVVTDDEPDVVFAWELTLKHIYGSDTQVETTVSSQEAFELAFRTEADLVLTGGNCPAPNGYELTAMLRAAGFEGPIVILTGAYFRPDEAQAAGADVLGYKTGDTAKMQEVFDGLLGRPPAGRTFALL